ncbi:hypothetical protein ACQ4PT_054455 [Festuca glaucescens]
MGDRGGRYNAGGGRRGGGGGGGSGGRNFTANRDGGGTRNLVWQREDGAGGGGAGAGASNERWDAAAAAGQGVGKDKAVVAQGGGARGAQQQQQQRTGKAPISCDASCLNCGSNPSFRDLEKEFTEYLGSGWRCTARPINPTQYTMRFPSAKEVDKALFYGKRMEMKTFNAIRNLSPWSAVVGTSGMLHKAWVRVRNIPPEKRNDKHAAYAGSLVGVTLEVDQATLHKPEFCRILLGCRDIDNLPESAEGVLGDFFYIFSYEIESVVFQGPPVVRNVVTVTNTFTPPSPKRARTENYSAMSATSADGYASTDQSVGTGFGRTHVHVLETISEHESEEESEYDSELLIDSIARENRDKHAKMDKGEPAVVNTGLDAGIAIGEITEKGYVHVLAHVTPVVEKERISPDPGRTSKQLVPSYVAAVMGLAWPAAPVVTEVGKRYLEKDK